jgi:hypothetical protein
MLCSPWAEDLEGCNPPEADPEIEEEALAAASEILYYLSGRIYPGLCEAVFRPCGSYCQCDYDLCGCNRLPRVFLGYDVVSVATVDIAGEILDPSAYLLEDGFLLRTDGSYWPCCQNFGAPPGDPDTFTVTGMIGTEPSALGIRAVKALATELVKACTEGEECALPARVTSIVRQGVSMAILDPMEFLDKGKTGIYIVDLFLGTVNPAGLTRRSSAWSPDLPVTRRTVSEISS